MQSPWSLVDSIREPRVADTSVRGHGNPHFMRFVLPLHVVDIRAAGSHPPEIDGFQQPELRYERPYLREGLAVQSCELSGHSLVIRRSTRNSAEQLTCRGFAFRIRLLF